MLEDVCKGVAVLGYGSRVLNAWQEIRRESSLQHYDLQVRIGVQDPTAQGVA